MSTILMFDDVGLFQLLEDSFFKRTGCRIVRIADRDDCVGKARALSPDLIVLVTDHPGLQGVECVRELKADPNLCSIPLIAVTDPDGVTRCSEAGADRILARPVTRSALVRTLESFGCVAKRTGERRSARMPAQLASPSGKRRGRVKDISRSGLFVTMQEPLAVDESVDLSLHLPNPRGRSSMRARGIVVRQVADDPDSHLIPGVGVRFVELDTATESLLDYFVGQAVLGNDPLDSDDGGKGQA